MTSIIPFLPVLPSSQILRQKADPWEHVVWFKGGTGPLFSIPIIVFGFNCHANAVTVFHELTEEPHDNLLPIKSYRKTNKLVNMILVILGAIGLIMTGYMAVGLAGYLAYPDTVTSNIMNSLPTTGVWFQVIGMMFISPTLPVFSGS
jgi:sodium-coupled neutral amino acid transporter 7/8